MKNFIILRAFVPLWQNEEVLPEKTQK